ncbi:MAG: 50S ribosomal protein L6 [Candidatus Harrisonbacteria bacterium RIFCSPLOWO2_02_FULL_45_10c]|uniref:Large ribosomal subunit protein uL6 n=1 Tax=Candidatus Harrisonbacteria bacterium RIFCSPLOWO2_02_FULL_45_10c TaxID=1798410 RepID=A0A1G1ZWT4_9BACT|nr:MAG: 50S ribosomal protein L6 [Candidatus Harrisonbacteria bacterium RIFCSPLOWO2_02_FULL_45_10c]
MSKVGKKPVVIPQDVNVTVSDTTLEVRGKGGTLTVPILPNLNVSVKDGNVVIAALNDDLQTRANWGTMRALAQNAITGVSVGFTKELEIQGVGFRAALEGNTLVLSLGFSHPVKFQAPEGVKIILEKNIIKISSSDKNLVGQVAAKIRAFKKPEPYQGKGIRYRGEVVKQKAGKKVATATAGAA